ncbi:Asp-tRNA(Asn)/Glu-tRNA(Gln) amidotransferase subunit GatC [Gryllotalpicola protaetiae]|uniref:Aspartyl/glutamyl-tRNA(Asn/Gln) amidotransferase subunit C n=1 Tax=Gryllotalpicola protaetiae TaxID=2419771 RepID=A0A387BLM5_9MICO|nr:Asp-tRNA(Asn)/Glu-tRNA(Gln) amidotransferase subunit GatC [Gryllotalpicola protaetiae]AYG02109.1 Asp-tRNA(Asn)/Glu-tRNA(Gln) amidotransferase subunit GatC [Gryllotalpicola protaetiae]
MSEISTDLVRHLAGLARIDLSEAEVESLTGELAQIVESIAKVSEVATPDVVATSHPIPLSNVFRDDEVRPSLTVEQALSGAPEREGDRFKVASILDEEQ